MEPHPAGPHSQQTTAAAGGDGDGPGAVRGTLPQPLARTVHLGESGLRRGGRTTPLEELNLAAVADAFLRGAWLGGGGAERPWRPSPKAPHRSP